MANLQGTEAGHSKYGNRRSESRDGHSFSSKRERDRYEELAVLQSAGEIVQLALQVRHPLVVNGVKIGTYISDFTYRERPQGPLIIEDVKGHRTQVYRLKKNLIKALYGVEILET